MKIIIVLLIFLNAFPIIELNDLSLTISVNENKLSDKKNPHIVFDLEIKNITDKSLIVNSRFFHPEPDINITIWPINHDTEVKFVPPTPPRKLVESDFICLSAENSIHANITIRQSDFISPLVPGKYAIKMTLRNCHNPFNMNRVWIGEKESNILTFIVK